MAVKIAGVFILRYRVFDLFSRAGTKEDGDASITAETYGGPFRVYSTKDFPGLPPSTTLTKVRGFNYPNYDRIFFASLCCRTSHDGAYGWVLGKRNERKRRKPIVMILNFFEVVHRKILFFLFSWCFRFVGCLFWFILLPNFHIQRRKRILSILVCLLLRYLSLVLVNSRGQHLFCVKTLIYASAQWQSHLPSSVDWAVLLAQSNARREQRVSCAWIHAMRCSNNWIDNALACTWWKWHLDSSYHTCCPWRRRKLRFFVVVAPCCIKSLELCSLSCKYPVTKGKPFNEPVQWWAYHSGPLKPSHSTRVPPRGYVFHN